MTLDTVGVAEQTRHAVVSIVDAETGEVRSTVVSDVTGATMMRVLGEHTDRPLTTIHTDSLTTYKQVSVLMAGHHFVDHSAGEYVSDKSLGTNKAENFFSQLKRSLDGTHHHVSPEHLQRYAESSITGPALARWTTALAPPTLWAAVMDGRSVARLLANGPVARGTRPRPPGRPGPRQSMPSSLPQTSAGAG